MAMDSVLVTMFTGNNCSDLDKIMTCPHLLDDHCALASWLAAKECLTTPEDCRACNRCKRPRDVNEVVLSLAGIKQSEEGPGTTLHKIITWFIPKPEGCDCANRVAVMNSFGYQRCLQELPTILSWLRESALDNNIPYSEYVIATVVKNILKHGLKNENKNNS